MLFDDLIRKLNTAKNYTVTEYNFQMFYDAHVII